MTKIKIVFIFIEKNLFNYNIFTEIFYDLDWISNNKIELPETTHTSI